MPAELASRARDVVTQAFAEELNARVSVIERYGHMLPIEAPRQTLEKLRELIGSLEQAA